MSGAVARIFLRPSRVRHVLIASTLPVTASIALGAFVLWMAIGVGLGTLAALKRGKWQDRVATAFSVIGVSLPTFFLGLIFIMVFVIWTGILPFPRYVGLTDNPFEWFMALILRGSCWPSSRRPPMFE